MATPASLVDINSAAKALGMTVEEVKKRMAKTPVTATVVVGKDPTFDVDVHVMAKQVKLLYDSERQCVCGVARDGVTQFAEVDKKDSVNHPEVFPWGPPNRIQRAH